jgi:hypothetical protein
MTAIITNQFRLQNLQYAKRDIDSGVDNYYLAIGRPNDWSNEASPPTPSIDYKDEANARSTMQSMKKMTDVVYCVPRYNWTNNTTYYAYDDNDPALSTKQFYVLDETTFNVYICLRAGSVPSTERPQGTGTGNPIAESDGYVWKYLYTIDVTNRDKYLTTDFMPVLRNSSVAAAATYGQIWCYTIVSGGAGYASTPTLNITGDGTSAAATVDITGGVITSITVTNQGSGYSHAEVSTTGGSPSTEAVILPVISPVSLGREITGATINTSGTGYASSTTIDLTIKGDGFNAIGTANTNGTGDVSTVTITNSGYSYTNATIVPAETNGASEDAVLIPEFSGPKGGFGYDPVVDLQAKYLMFNTTLAGDEGAGDFVPGNNYRQLMMIKNPLNTSATPVPFTDTTGLAMKYLELPAQDPAWVGSEDKIVSDGTASARVVYYDTTSVLARATNPYVYFVQDDVTGYKDFGTIANLTLDSVSTGQTATSVNNAEVDPRTGRMLYLENRVAVTRAPGQTEDIKLVVQF